MLYESLPINCCHYVIQISLKIVFQIYLAMQLSMQDGGRRFSGDSSRTVSYKILQILFFFKSALAYVRFNLSC